MRKFIEHLFVLVFLLTSCGAALAVTQQEMEQARTIAAKSYLRYANDGSGYLDDINPKTMAELEAALKTKEKENIKAFKAIPVPSDYKDWNKEKLLEYWAVTAFQNKGLLEKGRGGRIRARSQINKMTIAAPQPQAPSTATSPQPSASPASDTNPSPQQIQENQDSLAQQIKLREKEIANDEENLEEVTPNMEKTSSYTWVYIMVLAILVVIVVALVVYAANVMKKNNDRAQITDNGVDPEELEHLQSKIADKDVEIAMLNKKLEIASRQNSELKSKIDSLSAELSQLRHAPVVAPVAQKESKATDAPLRSIFLGRANAKGIFVRADRTLNVGHSVFVLETTDGYSGTFRVADSPAAWSLALSNPREYLQNACIGNDLDDTASASRIVTESSGTAVFEGGCWRVIRKARIKYEA